MAIWLLMAFMQVSAQGLILEQSFSGHLAPKSVVHNGKGLFFAQNMMYEHSISVFDRKKGLIKTISDSVRLSKFGHRRYTDTVQGAPCEAAVSHKGKYIWVANYAMYGKGFNNIANDKCMPNGAYDSSYVFKISTLDFEIKNAIKVGCVPKFLQVYNDSLLLVSNWCSGSVSVVSLKEEKLIKNIKLKYYPRGIAFNTAQKTAYIAQMGTYEIAKINLQTFELDSIIVPGRSHRHLCIHPKNTYLYSSLNAAGTIVKINLKNDSVEAQASTGRAPRSMCLSADGQYLYVVNYYSNTFSKIRTSDFKVLETQNTQGKPIGICFDHETKNVWVSCYQGFVQVFNDSYYGQDSLYEQTTTSPFALVIGSFGLENNAQKLQNQLQKNGFTSTIQAHENIFRVLVIGYNNLEAAEKARQENEMLTNAWILKM